MLSLALSVLAATVLLAALASDQDENVRWTKKLDASKGNDFYVGNRAPLVQTSFMKLPIGAIKPGGWLKRQLELQAEGFSGRLSEISRFLDKDHNAWLKPDAEGKNGWEEVPYWLKGQADLGWILRDKRIIEEAMVWIEGALKSQREDGWFGPLSNLRAKDGKPDLWPNMIMLFVLQSHYEHSGDKRVLELMTKYCRWLLALPDEDFLHPPTYWHFHRGGDNLISVLWLYNRTGGPFLLDLARKLHRHTADWVSGVPDPHGVNFAQAFREPATFWQVSKDEKDLRATERDLTSFRDEFGQFPGGMYGADENVRKGYTDPLQGTETCAMVEMMFSDEYLLMTTGDPAWADRAEEIAFNSFPASMTSNLKALRYLTSTNQVVSDRPSKHPGIQNTGPMFCMDPHDHRCCQHNVAQGWPYYAKHLWLATSGNGLAAALYSESEVTAKVGNGEEVTIRETTRYPFEDTVRFDFEAGKPVRFPLSLRIPEWCGDASVALNGKRLAVEAKPGGYVAIERTWRNDDKVELRLPMKVEVRTWKAQKGAVSVQRGPLSYSLWIDEEYVRSGGTDAWPAWEILPRSPWNYGLIPDEPIEVVEKSWPKDDQPFAPGGAPIELRARARKIANWKLDYLGLVGRLQDSPARTAEPVETVSLVPMGAARLRVSVFPTVSDTGHEWKAPPVKKRAIPASASHVAKGESTDALSDGLEPSSSSDDSIPRFTWWDYKGTTEWVQYDFDSQMGIGRVEVYWFDDAPKGFCRPPESWKVLYLANGEWVEAQPRGPYGVERDRFNVVELMPFQTTKLRLEVKLRERFSAGILEWRFR